MSGGDAGGQHFVPQDPGHAECGRATLLCERSTAGRGETLVTEGESGVCGKMTWTSHLDPIVPGFAVVE